MQETYNTLDGKLKEIQLLESVAGLIGWDEQVFLPENSQKQRQDQSAVLSSTIHAKKTDPEIGQLLAELESSNLDDEQAVVVKDARKSFDRSIKIPAEFVERHSRLCSEAFHTWAEARKNNDFASFAPFLKQHVDLAKERAGYVGWDDRPYDLMIDTHDPEVDSKTIGELFEELKQGLAPIAKRILESEKKARSDIFKGYPIEKQKQFLTDVTTSLGFDYSRGRIDTSLHPFCSGNGADTRMTTRFDEDNPLDSLFSSIHETGHGMYEQGLPLDKLHNALGQAAGMGVHESQSRLWENQVSRSRGFWKYYEPKFREAFSEQLKGITSDELYLAVNSVGRNPIRVDADEVSYNLHIIVRFEAEKKLFNGDLSVDDLPEFWNSQYRELIGVEPKDDAEGVLQDIHWSWGEFGYFPSYCLGNMLAAQLWYTANEQLPELEENFENGDFSKLLNWLRKNVHDQGSRYKLLELTRRVTGQELSPKPLLRYLAERYEPLYL